MIPNQEESDYEQPPVVPFEFVSHSPDETNVSQPIWILFDKSPQKMWKAQDAFV